MLWKCLPTSDLYRYNVDLFLKDLDTFSTGWIKLKPDWEHNVYQWSKLLDVKAAKTLARRRDLSLDQDLYFELEHGAC